MVKQAKDKARKNRTERGRKAPAPAPPSAELLSLRQYCAHRKALGLPHSLSTVQAAIIGGRIARTCAQHERCPVECGKGKIDPAQADLEWTASTDTRRRPTPEKAYTLQEAQLLCMVWRGRLDRQRYQEKQKILVRSDEVRAVLFKQARSIRDSLLSLPRRMAGRLAVESDRKKIERMIDKEIRTALEGLDDCLRPR